MATEEDPIEWGLMQLRRPFAIALILAGVASSQTLEDGLRSKIKAVRYAQLAESARIQGDVHLIIESGVVALVAGHPLLTPVAVASAKGIVSIQGETNLEMTYHFALAETTTAPTPITVPRGNAFERAVLRVFGRKTVKVVLKDQCQAGVPPANDLKIDGAAIEVWIFGRMRCISG